MVQDSKVERTKSGSADSKSWTLLVIGNLGKIASFEVSRFLLVGFLVTLGLLVVYAAVMTFGYYRVYSQKAAIEDRVAKAEADLVTAQADRDTAQVRLMLLGKRGETEEEVVERAPKKETVVRKKAEVVSKTRPEMEKETAEKKPKVEDKGPAKVTTAAADTAKTAPEPEAEATPTDEAVSKLEESSEPAPSEKVRVDNLEIWPVNNHTSVRFRFKLENISPGDATLKGYTFVALEPGQQSDEAIRVAPWSPLKNGEPSLIKRGQYFGISRYKFVRGTLPDIMDVTRFENATVFVYSHAGELLHKKTWLVEDILRS